MRLFNVLLVSALFIVLPTFADAPSSPKERSIEDKQATIGSDLITIDRFGGLHWNSAETSPAINPGTNSHSMKGIPTVSSKDDVGGEAILKGLDSLSDLGVIQIKLRDGDALYSYYFPSNPRRTPWLTLAILPRKDAIKISNHVFRFKEYPDAVLVLVSVQKETLSCDSKEGYAPIVAMLKALKAKYSTVSVGFIVQNDATYRDMMAALHSAALANIGTYYFANKIGE